MTLKTEKKEGPPDFITNFFDEVGKVLTIVFKSFTDFFSNLFGGSNCSRGSGVSVGSNQNSVAQNSSAKSEGVCFKGKEEIRGLSDERKNEELCTNFVHTNFTNDGKLDPLSVIKFELLGHGEKTEKIAEFIKEQSQTSEIYSLQKTPCPTDLADLASKSSKVLSVYQKKGPKNFQSMRCHGRLDEFENKDATIEHAKKIYNTFLKQTKLRSEDFRSFIDNFANGRLSDFKGLKEAIENIHNENNPSYTPRTPVPVIVPTDLFSQIQTPQGDMLGRQL